MKLSWFESRFSRRRARLPRKADDGNFTFDKDDDYVGYGGCVGDADADAIDDEGGVCIGFTSALFDKSNSARDVREERGPEVVFLNFWGFN